jgi:hypothetical protein
VTEGREYSILIIGYRSDSHHSLFAVSLKRADDLTALITNAETINW